MEIAWPPVGGSLTAVPALQGAGLDCLWVPLPTRQLRDSISVSAAACNSAGYVGQLAGWAVSINRKCSLVSSAF